MLKKSFLSLAAFTLLVGTVLPSVAAAEKSYEESNPENQEVQSLDLTNSYNEDEMEQIGEKVDDFLVKNEDGTITVDASAEELGTTEEYLEQFNQGIDVVNEAVKVGSIEVTDEFEVVPMKLR